MIIKILLAIVAMLSGTACQVPTIFGDSITVQMMSAGQTEGDGIDYQAEPGTRITDWLDELATTDASVVILALGTNDLLDGWATEDEVAWTTALNSVRYRTCVVIVLPHVQLENTDQGLARNWLMSQGVRYVDWRPIVLAHPEYIFIDGIHINAYGYDLNNQSAQARHELMLQAKRLCPRQIFAEWHG